MNLLNDIYYSKKYVSLYLKDSEKLFEFEYKEDVNIFYTVSIKRAIEKIGNTQLDEKYYDLETAYGYGGFYTNSDDKHFIKRAFKEYYKKCENEKIIAEFIRFHPFNNFPIKYNNYLEFNIYDRDVVIITLNKNIIDSYSSKVRNIIKKADKKVTIQKSDNLIKFINLYNGTMKRNSATDFYFFSEDIFKNLYKIKNIDLYKVVFENEIIAMGFFIKGEDFIHYHLSANSPLSYRLNANYALLYNLSEIAKKEGKSYFILGGGTTSLEDDSLFRFKKKFSKETKPFYISGKIYNKKMYRRYIELWEEQSKVEVKYFLKYRLDIA